MWFGRVRRCIFGCMKGNFEFSRVTYKGGKRICLKFLYKKNTKSMVGQIKNYVWIEKSNSVFKKSICIFIGFLQNEFNTPDFMINLVYFIIFYIFKKLGSSYLIGQKNFNIIVFFKKSSMFYSFPTYLKKSVKNHFFSRNLWSYPRFFENLGVKSMIFALTF